MDSYDLYEDLSLFNGDLLVETPAIHYGDQPIQDGLVSKAPDTPVSKHFLAQEVLSHAQYGSCELGLQDLLVESPTKGN